METSPGIWTLSGIARIFPSASCPQYLKKLSAREIQVLKLPHVFGELVQVLSVNDRVEGHKSSVKPPSRERAPKFPNATVFNLPPVQAMPGRELTFDVALALPPGYKVSTDAPLIYLAEANRPNAFGPEVSPTGQPVAEPSKEFQLKLPLARQAPTGSSLQVKLSVSAFVCLPNTLCTVKNYVWNVPITFAPGSPRQIKLTTATQ